MELSIELITVLLFGGMLILLFIGVPIFIAVGGIAAVFILIFTGDKMLYTVATSVYQQGTNMILLTIPMFTIMGNFLVHSGMAERMFAALNLWMGGVRGSLAIVSMSICIALAMCSGFGPGVIAMGLIAVPAMLRQNYNKSLATGLVIAGGALAEIIPPAIAMIVMSYIGRLSVGNLFAGGILPGVMLAIFYLIFLVILARVRPDLLPSTGNKSNPPSWRVKFAALKELILPVGLVVLVLGSILFGFATPTEAAGIGALGTVAICAINKRLNLKVIKDSCYDTMKITGMVLWIVAAASLFTVFYVKVGAQGMLLGFVEDLELNRWIILIIIQIILLIFGMFLDDTALIILCVPIFLPIAKLLGFDPYWFAILFLLNIQFAFLTPPFGYGMIMMRSVAPPGITTKDIWLGAPPFLLIQLFVLILVMVFPGLATWLPSVLL